MAQRAPKPETTEKPWSIFGDEPLPEGWGFPVYLNGEIIDWFVPPKDYKPDFDRMSPAKRAAFRAFGAARDLDWEETEAELERIDREGTISPEPDLEW